MMRDKILEFYRQLKIKGKVPKGIEVLNPYLDPYAMDICNRFYSKYYNDDKPRTLMLGINPGRFGSGLTGISFTDPIKLEKICGIENTLLKKPELSSDFIFAMIDKFGGPEKFYGKYFISAVSPLGFTKDSKNINYYDDALLEKAIKPFAIESISKILDMGIRRDKCFCIGEGENLKFLKKLNEENKWFGEVVPLSHPRFIMQYKRKSVSAYIDKYLQLLQ
ncbi:MAG: DUF4918 family protein [Cyclobacteriaceae bacterium]|nr:DUF4918 family protein [Cyclobacteriaceae bacterium]